MSGDFISHRNNDTGVKLQYLIYCPVSLLSGITEIKLMASNLILHGLVIPGSSLAFVDSNNWKEKFHPCEMLSRITLILFL